MAKTARNLIDGQWVGDPDVERQNPARPGEVAVTAPASDAGSIEAALAAAIVAQPGWAALPLPARGGILLDAADVLRARREEVARDLVAEEGKTLAEATGEVHRAIDVLRYFGAKGWLATGDVLPSSTPGTDVYTRKEPIGVAALITPWNFPIVIPAWKLAPALISGNTVVLKPAELTPLTADNLARALADAGLPPGVLNVVHGQGSVVGAALADDSRVGALSFTGSTPVGLSLKETLDARRARVQLEMGGKNGYLVLDDAGPTKAAAIVAAGGFGLTGQACTASSRVYCTPGIRTAFLAELAAAADRVVVGDRLAAETTMGPVVSQDQLDKDLSAVQRARAGGATVVAGGTDPDGFRFRPTVITDLQQDDGLVHEEVFGPVVAVLEVADPDEGVARINDSRYGLIAGICTRDLHAAQHFAAHAQVGVVKVNRPTTGLEPNVPFGGVKDSSTNTFREQGPHATDFYTWSKTIYLGHS
jgi:alpha-ketoglutaric semialdehyde dehydrogenase